MLSSIHEIYPSTRTSAVPFGLRVNDKVLAGRLNGVDLATGEPAGGLKEQVHLAFEKMRAVVEGAGGSLDNIGRATGYVSSVDDREPVNGEFWEALFPDPADRPAYKVILADLPPGQLVQLDVFAILGGRRTRIDLPGIPARDPTVRIGDMVFTSRCHGLDGELGGLVEGGLHPEAMRTFRTLRELVVEAGGRPEDIVEVNTFAVDESYIEPAIAAFDESFSDLAQKPALHTLVNYVTPRFAFSAEMTAVLGGSK